MTVSASSATPGRRPESKRVLAKYEPHPIARFANNVLICALPKFPLTRKALAAALTCLPDFNASERQLPKPLRKAQVMQLTRFFLGLPRVCELAEFMHAVMCEGYAGREPNTSESNAILQRLYESQQLGDFCPLNQTENTAQFCWGFTGMPGTGKSSSLQTIAARLYPSLIEHPEEGIYQIPVLYIEMAYNGVSLATLAQAIILAIAKKYPEGNYERVYLRRRVNAEQLLLDAFALVHVHKVGLILVDEAQNRDYEFEEGKTPARKAPRSGQAPLSTLLITASNQLQVPLILSGTAEMREVLGNRLSKSRRGTGMPHWGPLSLESKDKTPCEYDIFLNVLWKYQWLQEPAKLTPVLRNLFHFYSYGVPDFIVKLFYWVQWEALQSDSETFDEATIHKVAETRMSAITKVTAAMRAQDAKSLSKLALISDVAPEFGVTPTSVPNADDVPEDDVEDSPSADPLQVQRAKRARRKAAGTLAPEYSTDWTSMMK